MQETPSTVVSINNGVAVFGDSINGFLITSRRKFLYGTFKARVRYKPHAGEYIGFASRSPWQANALVCTSFTAPEGSGWHFVVSKDAKGGATGIDGTVPANQWCVLKMEWEKSRAAFYVDGQLKGRSRMRPYPQIPLPITIDDDFGFRESGSGLGSRERRHTGREWASTYAPAAPTPEGKPVILQSSDWKVVIDENPG